MRTLLLLFCSIFLLSTASDADAADLNKKLNILFVSSLGKDFPAQKQLEKGLNQEIGFLRGENYLYFEFLTTPQNDQFNDSVLQDFLKKKYWHLQFDYIIGWGAVAVLFLAKNPALFPSTQRIYLEPPVRLNQLNQLTGKEILIGVLNDYKESLREIIRVFDPKRMIVVGASRDRTAKGRLNRFNQAITDIAPTFEIDYFLDLPVKQQIPKLKKVKTERTVAFFLLQFSDGEGTKMTPFSVVQRLAGESEIPIFSHWESLLGSGIVGGNLMSQTLIGEYLGRLILSNNRLVGDLNFSPMRSSYDWNALMHWDIDLDKLPKEAVLINQPEDIWKEHRQKILLAALAILLLVTLSIFLIWALKLRNSALAELSFERKNLEKNVRERTQLLQSLAENYPNAYISVIDRAMKIGFTSGGEFKKQGLDPNQFVGMFVPELFAAYGAEILETVQKNYQKAFSGEEVSFEITVNSQNQIYRVVPLFNNRGEIDRILSVAENITEYKRLEKQLNQSNKMEAIEVLTGGIAHEFNNLLFPLLGYTELLMGEKTEYDPEFEDLKQMHTAVNKAKMLVRQMLAYGRQSLTQKLPIHLNTRLEEVVKNLLEKVPENITIRLEIEENIPAILGMPREIHQMLLNLCINAIQSMPDGGQLILGLKKEGFRRFINAEGVEIEGDFLRLSVQDTGSGMDQGTLERVFDPFFTTKAVGRGSGLGLSVVQGIVEQHQGHIEVESKLRTDPVSPVNSDETASGFDETAGGSTFLVYLPISKDKKNEGREEGKSF
ncbi:MAG: hypothetical protein HQM13_23410 [SAR324 cluster bacterium]|nr:hypothetical protein [SAR324 cluster bacterium]